MRTRFVKLRSELCGTAKIDLIALEGLGNGEFPKRASAVIALGHLGESFIEPIVGMLDDPYPQVRIAAIAALEHLQPTGEWRTHLKYECYIPSGIFIMGGPSEAHEVSVDAFYVSKCPVTNAEYKRYMEAYGREFLVPQDKDTHPVVNVSWYDAYDYVVWAGMRLLTEAEWEKAASWDEDMHQAREFPWGEGYNPRFDNKNLCNTEESGIGTTTPVGKYSPQGDSFYHVSDIAGNVWEWCSSISKAYPYNISDGREDLTLSSVPRIQRGGSFCELLKYASCSYRSQYSPHYRDDDVGFRMGWSNT